MLLCSLHFSAVTFCQFVNQAIDIQGFLKLKSLKEVEVEEKDLSLWQSLKDRHVNIGVINPFGGGDRREGDQWKNGKGQS